MSIINENTATLCYLANLCNSTIIEMYGDIIQVSHGFDGCQMLEYIADSTNPLFFKRAVWLVILIVFNLLWYTTYPSFHLHPGGVTLYIVVVHWSKKSWSVYILLCNLHISVISGHDIHNKLGRRKMYISHYLIWKILNRDWGTVLKWSSPPQAEGVLKRS